MKKMISAVMGRFAGMVIFGSLVLASVSAHAEPQKVWQSLGEQIVQALDQAQDRYKAGDAKEARRTVITAYFTLFESGKMEAALRTTIGAKHAYEVEQKFGDLRKAIKSGASLDRVGILAKGLREAIRQDAKVLDKAGVPAEVFKVNQ